MRNRRIREPRPPFQRLRSNSPKISLPEDRPRVQREDREEHAGHAVHPEPPLLGAGSAPSAEPLPQVVLDELERPRRRSGTWIRSEDPVPVELEERDQV